MQRDTELGIRERLLAHLRAHTTGGAPPSRGLPVADYLDEERYRLEVARLFEAGFVPVGHEAMLPEPGAYVSLEVGAVPLLLVRGDDGRARAFLNVCRHRGTRLAPSPRGCAKSFVCPYHAWTYGRDGSLLGVPHKGGFPGLDFAKRSLRERPLRRAGGLLWVSPSGEAAREPHTGELTEELGALFDGPGHIFSARTRDYRTNWKLIIEGALENYHVKKAHADTIYFMFLDNLIVSDHEGPNQRIVFPRRSLREVADDDPGSFTLRRHANLVYFLFPNTLALVQARHASFFHVFPLGIDRVRVSSYTVVPREPADERRRRRFEAEDEIMYAALDEDFAMAESIQSGFRSGANDELVLGSFEDNLRAFHDRIEADLAQRSGDSRRK